jgi:hypothetical protein
MDAMNTPEHYFVFVSVIIWLAVLAASLTLIVWPIAIIVGRTGRSRWWVFLILTGPGAYIGLWMLALCRWPALDQRGPETGTPDSPSQSFLPTAPK